MIEKINHIGIAVKSIKERAPFYQNILGLPFDGEEKVEDQGVKVAFFQCGDIRIELLEPLNDESPVAKFIEKRGEGVHHIAFQSDDIEGEIEHFLDEEIRMIDQNPRKGAHHMNIAFAHPKATGGVLTEICQKDDD
jgi:methylmalonyl-CoA/ethylmalonyl-CoA epimerase